MAGEEHTLVTSLLLSSLIQVGCVKKCDWEVNFYKYTTKYSSNCDVLIQIYFSVVFFYTAGLYHRIEEQTCILVYWS